MNMYKPLLLIFLLLSAHSMQAKEKASYVNPFIGTAKMGYTFPGACAPYGIVQLSPDTDTIPHSVNGVYQKMLTGTVPVINMTILQL